MNRIHTVLTVATLCAVAVISIAARSLVDKPKRFDYLVRESFFAGFSGDTAALAYGLQLCEDSLHKNPNHAEALVWHGSGIWYLSGQQFQSGNTTLGMQLADSGMREMDRAVELAPESIGTLIPRGATLLASAPYIPGPYGKTLLEKGVTDYQKAYEIQKPYLKAMSSHARGELIGGLAEGYRQAGNLDKARTYLRLLTTELPNTEYAKRAAKWLKLKPTDNGEVTLPAVTCIGCHTD